jgi:hypothetical protein
LRHEREWWIAFREITRFATGRQLRALFALALLHGAVGDPRKLWDDFKDSICDDLPVTIAAFQRRRPDLRLDYPGSHHDYGRFLLARRLRDQNRSLENFDLEPEEGPWDQVDSVPSADRPAIDPEAAAAMCRQLNDDQRQAFDRIVEAVTEGSPSRHWSLR